MPGPDLWKLFEGAPLPVQLLVGAMVAVGLLWLGLPAYLKKLREPAPSPDAMVLAGGTIADMKVVREATAHLATIAAGVTTVATLLAAQDAAAKEREEEAIDAELKRLRQLESEVKAKEAREGFRPVRRPRR